MFTTQWARLRAESSAPLRRGAWYRVLRLTQTDAVLDVNERPMNVPRPALHLASRPPSVWGIVPRPLNAKSLPTSWGARYAVVEDPDGNAVGIMSPSDPDRRSMARPPGQSTG